MKDDVVLQATGLKKSFGQGDGMIRVLDGIDLTISRGERVAIVGLSGSGKSTLLHLLAGLDQPDAGQIFVNGDDIANLDEKSLCRVRNETLGFVYQFHYLMSEFTAAENVAMPLMIGGLRRKAANRKANEVLARVGLGSRLTHKPGQLSGGERQRVAIARALVTMPLCVLADEPTGNLDEKTAEGVNQLLVDLSDELKMSFIIVTHNHDLARKMDRTLNLHNGLLEVQNQ
jgi:lipoprotein-releasing system ATP-binding protein